jgi:hypothetical protein
MRSSKENSSAVRITGYLLIIITLVYYCIIFDHHRDLGPVGNLARGLEKLGQAFAFGKGSANDLPVSLHISGPFFVIIALCDVFAVLYLLYVSSIT